MLRLLIIMILFLLGGGVNRASACEILAGTEEPQLIQVSDKPRGDLVAQSSVVMVGRVILSRGDSINIDAILRVDQYLKGSGADLVRVQGIQRVNTDCSLVPFISVYEEAEIVVYANPMAGRWHTYQVVDLDWTEVDAISDVIGQVPNQPQPTAFRMDALGLLKFVGLVIGLVLMMLMVFRQGLILTQ